MGRLLQAGIYAALLAINLWLLSALPLARADRAVLDQFFRLRPPLRTDSSIVLVEIAEDGLRQIGRWPWPRQFHAALIYALHAWGAKTVMFDVLFSEPSTPFDDDALGEAIAESGRVYLPVVMEEEGEARRWVRSLPEMERSAAGVGHINSIPDGDGILRRIDPYLQVGSERFPYLALKIACDALYLDLPKPGEFPFPVDSEGKLLVNWAGRWTKTFRHYSYVDILRSFEAASRGEKPLIPPEAIRGKICLVGLTAIGQTDIKTVPLEPLHVGVGVQANVLNSFLTRQFIRPAPRWADALIVGGLGLLVSLFFIAWPPVAASIASGVCAVLWSAAAFVLFCRSGIWFSVAHPVLCVVSIFLASVITIEVVGQRVQRRLYRLATRDGLTDLYVIRHFWALLNLAVKEAHRAKAPLSVLMVDVDYFKSVNDTHGHAAGDWVLKKISAVVRSCLREASDVAGRYGGEEIIVMLPRLPLDMAVSIAERIRKAVESGTPKLGPAGGPVTVSVGVSTLAADEAASDALVRRADEALYQAKQSGRNRVCAQPGGSSCGTIGEK
ncbi:MAG: CHASE2 domain-containing protein [Candidatus Omnitrophica bacterium]|nr:CHASE2 domain-containing protein [Candidatus Omnitrophota bacterium]